ncbi:HepT-like ribonuclease domain-containing protein [Williamsia sp. M5A3_1d]
MTSAEAAPAARWGTSSTCEASWAVEMGLIRIGEGINLVPDGVLAQVDGQPWRAIAGMRTFAAHQYADIVLPELD